MNYYHYLMQLLLQTRAWLHGPRGLHTTGSYRIRFRLGRGARPGRPTPAGEGMCYPVLVSIDRHGFARTTFPILPRQGGDGGQWPGRGWGAATATTLMPRITITATITRSGGQDARRLQQLHYVSTNPETGRESGRAYPGTRQPVLVGKQVYLVVASIGTGSDAHVVTNDGERACRWR